MKHSNQSGFTLVELLLYVGLLAVFLNAAIIFTWQFIFGQAKARVERNVGNNLQVLGQKLSFELRQAESIIELTSSDLCLEMQEASRNPTRIFLQDQAVYLSWGGGGSDCSVLPSTSALTDTSVQVTSLSFQDLSVGNSSHVSIEATLQGKTAQSDWQKVSTLRTSVELGR